MILIITYYTHMEVILIINTTFHIYIYSFLFLSFQTNIVKSNYNKLIIIMELVIALL